MAEAPWDPYELAAVLHRSLHLLDRMERESTGDRVAAVADIGVARDGHPWLERIQ